MCHLCQTVASATVRDRFELELIPCGRFLDALNPGRRVPRLAIGHHHEHNAVVLGMMFFHQPPSHIQGRIEICASVWTYKCRYDTLGGDLCLYLQLRARVVGDDGDFGVILKEGVLLKVGDELRDCRCQVRPLARPVGVLRGH